MGYTTEFEGQINVDPPLNENEIKYLKTFSSTRHMRMNKDPFDVHGEGLIFDPPKNQIIDYNIPPCGFPGLWCQWIPTNDGSGIIWDGGEKFYDSAEWMEFIIYNFLMPGAKNKIGIFEDHICNGIIKAQGEDRNDTWNLLVHNNVVSAYR